MHKDNRDRPVHSQRANAAGGPVRNSILTSIPDSEFRLVAPYLEFVSLEQRRVLHEPNEELEFAHFLNHGLISLVIAMEDGRTVEAGLVWNEGVAGIPLAVGITRSLLREVVLLAGDGFRIRARSFENILRSTPRFQAILCRYAVVQRMQVAQTSACNRLHDIEQRLARWLLMAHDRMDNGSMFITHDFLATMLGTDRPSVSSAASILQKKANITYTRGVMTILNRKRLEKSACECYRVIRNFDEKIATHF